jgi:hypothetical protein
MDRTTFERALANAFGDRVQQRSFAATQNVTSGVRHRRFCRACASKEWAATRESYWHRAHHLPGVWLCLEHKEYLVETTIAVSATKFDLSLPHECTGKTLGTGPPPKLIAEVARVAVDWLDRPRGLGVAPTPAEYRELAIKNGWLSGERQVNAGSLAEAVRSSLPARFLESAGVRLPKSGGWAGLMLRPGTEVPFVPAKHAVLLAVLSRPGERPGQLDHVPTGPGGTDADMLDRFCARAVIKATKAALRDGRTLTTKELLQSAGCTGPYKHRKDELPLLKVAIREFRGSHATVKSLGAGKKLFRHGQ